MSDVTGFQWIRLDVDWDASEWLDALPWAARAVWPVVLCHVKVFGNGRGSCKALSAERLARTHDIPVECVRALLDAACSGESPALVITGDRWTVTSWARYQTPDAARMRQARAAQQSVTNEPEQEPNVTSKCEQATQVTNEPPSDAEKPNVTNTAEQEPNVTNEPEQGPNVTNRANSCHATMTETMTKTETEEVETGRADAPPPALPPPDPPGARKRGKTPQQERFDRVYRILEHLSGEVGGGCVMKADVTRELNSRRVGLVSLLEFLDGEHARGRFGRCPEDVAVEMNLLARETWRGGVTWEAIARLDNRATLLRGVLGETEPGRRSTPERPALHERLEAAIGSLGGSR